MLAIRMQRTGRKGHAQFRVIIQDSRRTPTSGKVVATLGHYNPHSKETTLEKDKAAFYLEHGAQPSERVALLLQAQGVKLPVWAITDTKKTGKLRHPDKLRRNRPAEVAADTEAPTEEPAETPAAEDPSTPAEESEAAPAEAAAEVPAESDETTK